MNDIQEIDGINFNINRLKLKHQAIIHMAGFEANPLVFFSENSFE